MRRIDPVDADMQADAVRRAGGLAGEDLIELPEDLGAHDAVAINP